MSQRSSSSLSSTDSDSSSLTVERFLSLIDTSPLVKAVDDLYRTLVWGVIKRDFLLKKGNVLSWYTEYWYVLRATELELYKTERENDRRVLIHLNSQSRIESVPCTRRGTLCKIILTTGDRSYELATFGERSRRLFISAVKIAIDNARIIETFQQSPVNERRDLTAVEFADAFTEHFEIIETQSGRMSQKTAAQKLRELRDPSGYFQRKGKDLLELLHKLEVTIGDKYAAQWDKEVRAKVLEKECKESREEIARIKEEQRRIAEQEKKMRAEFKRKKMQKRQKLKEVRIRLRSLKIEKKLLDKKLSSAKGENSTSQKSGEKN